jgi:hypothetical protein
MQSIMHMVTQVAVNAHFPCWWDCISAEKNVLPTTTTTSTPTSSSSTATAYCP